MFQNFEIIKISEFQKIISERTILYNLEPIGIGTPYVESLSSYLVRLATVHQVSVSVLLNKVIELYLNSSFVKKELKDGITKDTSGFINENNFVTLDFVNALEILTGRTDLRALTILNWAGLINDRSVSKFRKWCPCCLEDMRNNLNIVYEPLLWYMKLVEYCDIHNVPLKNTCWNCNKTLKFLGSKISMGFCQHCHSWLGECQNGINIKMDEFKRFKNTFIKELLINSNILNCYPISNFISSYIYKVYIESKFDSVRKLAFALDIDACVLRSWLNKTRKPNNESLIRLVHNCNINFVDFINLEISTLKLNYTKRTNDRNLKKSEIRSILLQELNSQKSVSKIAGELNINIDVLQKNFPMICEEITLNYRKHKEHEKKIKREKVKRLLTENLDSDIPKSVTSIFRENNIPYVSGKRLAPDLVKKVVKRYKDYLKDRKKHRIEKVINEIAAIINDLHSNGLKPNVYNVDKRLSNPQDLRKPEIYEGYIQILKKYGYEVE